MNEDNRAIPEDRPGQEVRDEVRDMVPWPLLPALTPVATMVGEKVYERWQSRETISVQVLDSKLVENSHKISFRLTNNTRHGAYVEDIRLVAPEGEYKVTFGPGYDWAPESLPRPVGPTQDINFDVEFPLCKNRGPDSDWSGTLELDISRLDQKKPEKESVDFRIRWN